MYSLLPNSYYAFHFLSSLSSLDGIYIVNSILSYQEVINSGVDIYKSLYQPFNITSDQFNTDLPSIRQNRIIKLTSISDSTIQYYVPELFIDKVPDASIRKYLNIGIAATLGVFPDATFVTALQAEITQLIHARTGNTNTVLYTINEQWLTADQYETIETSRTNLTDTAINVYNQNKELQKQITSLQTRLSLYEQILKSKTT